MKIRSIILLLFLNGSLIFCQSNANSDKTIIKFKGEYNLYSKMYDDSGSGFTLGLEIASKNLKNTIFDISIGKRVSNFSIADKNRIRFYDSTGTEIIWKPTSYSIFTPEAEKIGGIPDESLFAYFNDQGFYHMIPGDASATDFYFTLEFLRKIEIKKNQNLKLGGGFIFGQMERSRFAGALSDEVLYFGNPIKTWITYRILSKYLYYGLSSKIEYQLKINQYFNLLINGGLQVPMTRTFGYDDWRLYSNIGIVCKLH